MSNLPLSERLRGAGLDTLKEILREAELHLTSQQTVALAADQRAVTLIGFLSAAVVVLVGAATSFALGSQANIALTVICLMVAIGLMAAAIIALSTAKPSPFDFAGSSPEDWVNDVAEEKSLEVSLAEQCQNHAEAISGLAAGKWRALLKERGAFHGQAAAPVRQGVRGGGRSSG